jgi:acetylornithine deacetylase/succinyl-diaminopimelate desuccinylase-like protein
MGGAAIFASRIATQPDGRKIIVARGACDDKGQLMTFVRHAAPLRPLPAGCRSGHDDRGREECRSDHLFGFVREHADELKRDLALVCDTSMWIRRRPW